MEQRPLGTGTLTVSRLGWGTVKLGRATGVQYAEAFDLPDDAQSIDIVHRMLDLGITLIDTAPAYGLAQTRLGPALHGRRDDVVIISKVGETFDTDTSTSSHDFDAEAARASLEQSLRDLRCDHVDLLLVHSDGNDLANQGDDYIAALQDLRSRGLTRGIGFSGKTVEGHRHALRWADALMVPYSLQDRTHERLIAEAADAGAGVFVKKALDKGHLDPAAALHWCWHASPVKDAITSVVVGSLSPRRMGDNAAVLNSPE